MASNQNRGRGPAGDTGAAAARARDDLYTASKKKAGTQRDDERDRESEQSSLDKDGEQAGKAANN